MSDSTPDNRRTGDSALRMTSEMVSAYLNKNTLAVNQVPDLIRTVYATLTSLGSAPAAPIVAENTKPAVPVKKSITPEYIICLEDGRKLKMLKRHLRTTYNMTPEQYRTKWGLPADYPMVAPKYAEQRSAFAKKIGLGKGAVGRPAKKRVA